MQETTQILIDELAKLKSAVAKAILQDIIISSMIYNTEPSITAITDTAIDFQLLSNAFKTVIEYMEETR